jgi:hypothetical protein
MPEGGTGRRCRKNIYLYDIITYILLMSCGWKMQHGLQGSLTVATKTHFSEKGLEDCRAP